MAMLRRHDGRDLRVPVMYAQALVRLGRVQEGRAVIASAGWDEGAAAADVLWWNVSEIEVLLDNHERATALIAPYERSARAAGDVSQLSSALEGLAAVDVSVGRLVAANAAAVESVELAAELEQELLQQAFSAARLATTAAAIGSDDTSAFGDRALQLAARCDSSLIEAQVVAALGAYELSLGSPERAIEHLERVRTMVRGGGYRNPAFIQYAPELIEAYVHEGRVQEASAELDELEADAQAAGTPWAHAVAARCGALTSDDFDVGFEQALAHHERSPRRVERARTHLAYGSRLRRAGRRTDARMQLRAALESFEAAGAATWAERARAELAASGETIRRDPSAREELTPQELQVAMAVAKGATNKEVAAQLFLSTKTIEFHLRNAFRKVGVRSRTELANALRES
jgi:DNA-binding CsgD family transcriptional regulator